MNRRGSICLDVTVLLLTATLLFVFWRFTHIELINYHEEYQLFLFNADYFTEHLRYPGGIAAWVAKFLTQFFIIASAGATVLTILLISLLLLVRRKVRTTALALIPVALMVAAMGDGDLMLAYLVSIIMAMIIEMALPRAESSMNIALVVLASILSYWVTGPMAWLTVLLIAFRHIDVHSLKTLKPFGSRLWLPQNLKTSPLLAAIALTVLTFISCKISAFPAQRIITGLYYYRNPMETIGLIPLSVPIVILVLSLVPRTNLKTLSSLAVIAISIVLVPKNYNPESCERMRYDYYMRAQLWNEIIDKADKKKPTDPFCICALNLALAKRGELCDRMFDYYLPPLTVSSADNSNIYEAGLLPFEPDHYTPLASAEVLWHMGLVNSAQQYCFEAMEAIPDYQKSGRIMKRLAQTNIVNGQYDVARKYLVILKQTLLYRFWADKEMARLNMDAGKREMSINADPLYGRLRMLLLDEDVFFRNYNADIMFGKLFLKNKSNTLAKQYLIAYPLVKKDLNTFLTYMTVVRTYSNYMPTAAQEAMSIIMHQQGNTIRGNYFRYLNSQ